MIEKIMAAWICGCAVNRMNRAWAEGDYGLATFINHELVALQAQLQPKKQADSFGIVPDEHYNFDYAQLGKLRN